ncbi:3-hydroxyacyl-CoA dehydrogenase / enoyl-CoA hydratase / 3-hydroxybutyryl-CoA epimerase [Prosthecobacter debontii]|uniref:enoyl-CoA hydratase n=1 Tax=Prosthecobacter debontii TaxID=48467 RepID=A0A1T4YNR3_9BACT|nr:3-hydroxyacyl-CoA dehydrogenase NAD-binding domain-containing protein [Prosthecobacter debontii]SKB03429.1 3-hydroxyacyl-CoA dehydrogenase / enoyl-CoA hydratase / 3-hydroxybutyryl-CoA epimerase [Prosthecobacter debontii]
MKTHLLENIVADKDSFIPNPPTPANRVHSLNHFKVERDHEDIAWITFDMQGSAANVWNENTLREFALCLEALSREGAAKALVIQSAKDKIFIAGADLKAVRNAPVRRVETLIQLGQKVFNRLAAMPMPKLALIHGACLGGGLELALACDARLASDSEQTRLGLPETQIGLIPAWGGSTRLPQLLGLPTGLELIVTGKLLKPSSAKRLGLVDQVVPREHLEKAARKMITEGLPKRDVPLNHAFWKLPGIRNALAHRVRNQVLEKTRGLYQAPLRAIEVATAASAAPLEKAMDLERHAILDLALTPQTEHLIDLFFRKEEASKKPYPRGVAMPIHEVAVIGAGVMGSGIAHWAASRGNHVLMQDIHPLALAKGLGRIQDLLKDGIKRRALTRRDMQDTLDRLTMEHTSVPLARYHLVIEAATEDMELKKKIFTGLAERSGPDAILATNTSALSIAELAATVPHPERVIGLHFFNPVHRMPLVEVIVTDQTSDDVTATAVAFVQRLGKTPIVVKDSPGFVVNRILMPYLMEAVRLHETGVAAEVIDEAMLEFGMPMGPMRLLDEIGLDVADHVANTLCAAYPDRLTGSSLLKRLVTEGKLGKKTGQGFYSYKDGGRNRKTVIHHDDAMIEHVQHRLALLLSNEAARCAYEGLTRQPSEIDLAMILGTGYPPFRGGPLAWLNDFGTDNAAVELRMLNVSTPEPNAFEPAAFPKT